MRGVNKVILIGNLGANPEKRSAGNGNSIANISIATSESWKDKNSGEMRERTEWHRVVFFGRLADIVCEYAHKGSKIYVEGRLQTRKWTDQNNVERYSTEVVVDVSGSMQLLDSAPRGGGNQGGMNQSSNYDGSDGYGSNAQYGNQNTGRSAQQPPKPPPMDAGFDDDIPF